MSKITDLPDEWRELAASVNDQRSPSLLVDCAQELEAALQELELKLIERERERSAEITSLRDSLAAEAAMRKQADDKAEAARKDLLKAQARRMVLHGYVTRLCERKHRTCDCPERVLSFMEEP